MAVRVEVRLPAALRDAAGGVPTLVLDLADGATVGDAIDLLARRHPRLERRVRDEAGAMRPHVNVFVGDANIRDLDGLASALAEGAELTVLPAVSGGAPAPTPTPDGTSGSLLGPAQQTAEHSPRERGWRAPVGSADDG